LPVNNINTEGKGKNDDDKKKNRNNQQFPELPDNETFFVGKKHNNLFEGAKREVVGARSYT
jgi:spore cortex formation protein SpoVR/YcgB (stage V sporulation)